MLGLLGQLVLSFFNFPAPDKVPLVNSTMYYYVVNRYLVSPYFTGITHIHSTEKIRFVGLNYAISRRFQLTSSEILVLREGYLLGELYLGPSGPVFQPKGPGLWTTVYQDATQALQSISFENWTWEIIQTETIFGMSKCWDNYFQSIHTHSVFGVLYDLQEKQWTVLPHPCTINFGTDDDQCRLVFNNHSNPLHTWRKRIEFKDGDNIDKVTVKCLYYNEDFKPLHTYNRLSVKWYYFNYYDVLAYNNKPRFIVLPYFKSMGLDVNFRGIALGTTQKLSKDVLVPIDIKEYGTSKEAKEFYKITGQQLYYYSAKGTIRYLVDGKSYKYLLDDNVRKELANVKRPSTLPTIKEEPSATAPNKKAKKEVPIAVPVKRSARIAEKKDVKDTLALEKTARDTIKSIIDRKTIQDLQHLREENAFLKGLFKRLTPENADHIKSLVFQNVV